MCNADLREADCRGTELKRAQAVHSNFSGANLVEADLRQADLTGADFSGADLTGASLAGSVLTGAYLNGADLTRADFHQAHLGDTVLANVDLSIVQGLATCHHQGPSSVDQRTLGRSGTLPIAFLRGCGLSDRLIDYLPSLLEQPIQFYTCFISYSTKDQEFAERLHADLQDSGVRCWFAPHALKAGEKIHQQIDEAIRFYDRLLLILSAESMTSSWVKVEIAHARDKERALGRQVCFPISLVPFEAIRAWRAFNADLGEDTAREIREYFIPDFSGWKRHDAYKAAFGRLLRDLKAE